MTEKERIKRILEEYANRYSLYKQNAETDFAKELMKECNIHISKLNEYLKKRCKEIQRKLFRLSYRSLSRLYAYFTLHCKGDRKSV